MFRKEKVKMLSDRYDHYKVIKEKVDSIAKKTFKNDDEIFKSKLYNLVLNLCNQVIYDYTYTFTNDDFNFIIENDINVMDLIDHFVDEIYNMKKMNDKKI